LAEETHVFKEEYGQTKSYEDGTNLDGLNPAAGAHDDEDDE
jgi:hypothetical protein